MVGTRTTAAGGIDTVSNVVNGGVLGEDGIGSIALDAVIAVGNMVVGNLYLVGTGGQHDTCVANRGDGVFEDLCFATADELDTVRTGGDGVIINVIIEVAVFGTGQVDTAAAHSADVAVLEPHRFAVGAFDAVSTRYGVALTFDGHRVDQHTLVGGDIKCGEVHRYGRSRIVDGGIFNKDKSHQSHAFEGGAAAHSQIKVGEVSVADPMLFNHAVGRKVNGSDGIDVIDDNNGRCSNRRKTCSSK